MRDLLTPMSDLEKQIPDTSSNAGNLHHRVQHKMGMNLNAGNLQHRKQLIKQE